MKHFYHFNYGTKKKLLSFQFDRLSAYVYTNENSFWYFYVLRMQ